MRELVGQGPAASLWGQVVADHDHGGDAFAADGDGVDVPMVVGEGQDEHAGGLQQPGHVLDASGQPPGSSDDVGDGRAAAVDEVGIHLRQGAGVGELAEVEQPLQEEVGPVRFCDGLFTDPHRGAGVAAEVGAFEGDRLVPCGEQVDLDIQCSGVLLQRFPGQLDRTRLDLGNVGGGLADHVRQVLDQQAAGLADHPRHGRGPGDLPGGDRGDGGGLCLGREEGVGGHHGSSFGCAVSGRGYPSTLPINGCTGDHIRARNADEMGDPGHSVLGAGPSCWPGRG